MDEQAFEKTEGFDVLRRDIGAFLEELATYVTERLD